MKIKETKCKGCRRFGDCPFKVLPEDIRQASCPYSPDPLVDKLLEEAKTTLEYFESKTNEYYQESLRLQKEENFDAKYCKKCDLRQECALMKLDEKIRRRICVYTIPDTKIKTDIDPFLLKPLTQSQLN